MVFTSSDSVSEDGLENRKSSLSACPDISCILVDAFPYRYAQIRDRQIKHAAITSLLAKLVFLKRKHTVRIQDVKGRFGVKTFGTTLHGGRWWRMWHTFYGCQTLLIDVNSLQMFILLNQNANCTTLFSLWLKKGWIQSQCFS